MSEGTEKFEALSIGAVFGGPSEDDQRWWPDIQWLMNAVIARRQGARSPLAVNVVYHVDGEFLPPVDFEGVRTGRLSRKRMVLMVQAAVPMGPVDDRRDTLLRLLAEAVLEAERLAKRRKIADGLPEIRAIVDAVVRERLNDRAERGVTQSEA